jgi:hypothetical protein
VSKTNFKLPSNALVNVSIRNALSSESSSRISVKIINENEMVNYDQDGKERHYKTYVIADSSATTILIVYDQLIELTQIDKNYIFTNIKTKKILNDIILTTTPNTTISESETVS